MTNQETNNRIETVCFTGHRELNRQDAFIIPGKLKKTLEALILRGATHFRAGGAMGFDTVAALCVLELKEKFPRIKLDLILPCQDQTALWHNDSMVDVYRRILTLASSVTYTAERYHAGCMYARNRSLVQGSQVCVAYLTQSRGGTAYTYGYALSQGLEVINIAEEL